jgi:hypothetical protein
MYALRILHFLRYVDKRLIKHCGVIYESFVYAQEQKKQNDKL